METKRARSENKTGTAFTCSQSPSRNCTLFGKFLKFPEKILLFQSFDNANKANSIAFSGDFESSSFKAMAEVVNCICQKLGIIYRVWSKFNLFITNFDKLFLVKQQSSNIGRLMKFPISNTKLDTRTYIVRFASIMVSMTRVQVRLHVYLVVFGIILLNHNLEPTSIEHQLGR